MFRFADHIGGIVRNTDDNTLHGVSWGSRRFYRWTLGVDGKVTNADAPPATLRTLNPSHYVDYQDCKYVPAPAHAVHRRDRNPAVAGRCTVPPRRHRPRRACDDGRPRASGARCCFGPPGGMDMTHNPVWIEPTATGLRGYFMPEDDKSTLYVYEVEAT